MDDESPDPVATPAELGTYLGVTVDQDRAALLLDLATGNARALRDPLPASAKSVVLAAAARAYANPTQNTSESVGPYSVANPFPGLYFTKQERATLRAGRGGAFTIDPTPADAGTGLPPWDRNIPGDGTEAGVRDEGAFDEWWPV